MASTATGPLPLTTTFTPPQGCLHDLWAAMSGGSTWMNLGPINTAECLPSGWAPASYFSPGVCPSGYAIASESTAESGTATQTIATCCPVAQVPALQTNEVCEWTLPSNIQTTYNYTWTDGRGSTSSALGTMGSNGILNAYGVEIRWQSTDTGSVPASATATTTPTSTDIPYSVTDEGLSTGAKAGIGVGVAVGVVLVIALTLGFLLFRRRQRQTQRHDSSSDVDGPDARAANKAPVELSAARHTNSFVYVKPELASTSLLEMASTPEASHAQPSEAAELDGQSAR
ncbi:hypothetical protein N7474_006926 [Penicillium riverlandense]|uniref:uncharacterized protein n=1 Tax=Penicillium riverlandense TaxID=1903569 RepID=UPI0025475A10|nr:uncharacterized protein N7474_006926 [Penicillium riverlandense]KAJ5815149.1 hypothetical protein N7474_006926 [Penicillium riverlandense]